VSISAAVTAHPDNAGLHNDRLLSWLGRAKMSRRSTNTKSRSAHPSLYDARMNYGALSVASAVTMRRAKQFAEAARIAPARRNPCLSRSSRSRDAPV